MAKAEVTLAGEKKRLPGELLSLLKRSTAKALLSLAMVETSALMEEPPDGEVCWAMDPAA